MCRREFSNEKKAPETVQSQHSESTPRAYDQGLTVFFLILAVIVGMTYVAVFGGYARFEKDNFGPAVMFALGRGYVNPCSGTAVKFALARGCANPCGDAIPGLEDFLTGKTTELDVHNEELPEVIPTYPLGKSHVSWKYLMYSVGALWRIFGISLNSLLPLYGLLYAVTGACAYAIFRLGIGRLCSAIGALLLILSPVNLYFLPHLRDYSKVPFILATILFLGLLIKAKPNAPRLIVMCAGLGCILGLGLGFRRDVMVFIPAAVFVIFFLTNTGITLAMKGMAGAALCIGFLLVGYPVLSGLSSEGSGSFHVVTYGLLPPFDDFTGIGGVPYALAPFSTDADTYMLVESYAKRFPPNQESEEGGMGTYETPTYDNICRRFFLEYAKTFPADLLIRCYGAILRVLDYGPFTSPEESRYGRTRVAFIERMFNLRWSSLHWLSNVNWVLLAVTLAILSARSIRSAMGLAFIFAYCAGITNLQFDLRHHFHTEILFWWPVLFVLNCLLRGSGTIYRLLRQKRLKGFLKENARALPLYLGRMAVTFVILAAVALMPLAATRVVQAARLHDIYQSLEMAELEPISTQAVMRGAETIMTPTAPHADLSRQSDCWDVYPDYLVAKIEAPTPTAVTVEYTPRERYMRVLTPSEFSDKDEAISSRFFPVYERDQRAYGRQRQFQGLVMWSEQADRFRGLYRVKNCERFPLLLDVVMTAPSRRLPAYKTLQPEVLPLYARAERARQRNLLVVGGMNDWSQGGAHPLGFSPPAAGRFSSISKETRFTSEGAASVRQVWTGVDGADSIFRQFRVVRAGLEPCTRYEFYVAADNLSPDPIGISVWDVQRGPDGQLSVNTRLAWRVVEIKPCPTFTEYGGYFTTGPYEDHLVSINTFCNGPSFPATALWDDWRIAKVDGDPWRIPAEAFGP